MSLWRLALHLVWSYLVGIALGGLLVALPASYIGHRLVGHGSAPVGLLFLVAPLLLLLHPAAHKRPLVAVLVGFLIAAIAAQAIEQGLAGAAVMPFIWVVLTLPIIAGGAILGLPLLLTALIALVCFRGAIERHLVVWCILAPFAVTAAWALLELLLFGQSWGITTGPQLPNVGLWTRVVLALVSAAIATQKFYELSRSPSARML